MRSYKCTPLRDITDIQKTIEIQFQAVYSLRNLMAYYSTDPIRRDDYNNYKTMCEMCELPCVPLDDHAHWQSKFTEVCELLNTSSESLMNFLQTAPISMIEKLKQVTVEQHSFIGNREAHADCYYLEIFVDHKRIISMFVRNNPPFQLHFFIVNDLKYVIDGGRELPNSSLFMHSFASSLFGNVAWYTNPVGIMQDILRSKLRPESHQETPYVERQSLVKIINSNCSIFTVSTVEPAYKYHIGEFMRNLWKTKKVLLDEQLGDFCEYEVLR